MKLVLFDIDGTLVHSNRIGRTALGRALRDTFGTVGALETISFNGMTDRGLVRELMQAEGWLEADVEERLPHFYERMAAAGRELFTPEHIRPCPGVVPLLAALAARADVVMALLTGNIRDTAPLKLAAAGIDPAQFRVGAFGSDSAVRDELFAIALARAEAHLGLRFAPRDVMIVGDTPGDISCARAGGSRVIAVATGPYSADALRDCRPDHLFNDLTVTQTVLQALFERGSA
jgi:phosphoglycolate phosphatase-like HAD superfamily hydrolase